LRVTTVSMERLDRLDPDCYSHCYLLGTPKGVNVNNDMKLQNEADISDLLFLDMSDEDDYALWLAYQDSDIIIYEEPEECFMTLAKQEMEMDMISGL